MLYGPVINQSNCRKAGPYQLPNKNFVTKVGVKYDYEGVKFRALLSQISIECGFIQLETKDV